MIKIHVFYYKNYKKEAKYNMFMINFIYVIANVQKRAILNIKFTVNGHLNISITLENCKFIMKTT